MTIKERWVSWEEFDLLFPGISSTSTIDFERVGGLIPGSIPFGDASGLLTEDNAGFFWDETNARLGLNQVVPTARIDIVAEASFPAINIAAGASGEMSTPDGQQFRWGHWNEVDTFTERLKFDAAGIFYVSYLSAGSVVFAGAGGEIKEDNADLYWDTVNKRLGIGKVPSNPLDVEGLGTDVGGNAGYTGVVARFHNTIAAKHTQISIDALTGYDPVLCFAENGAAVWDVRNDASVTDEFQIRYQVGDVNLTYFIILPTGDIQIPLGFLALMNNEELRFYDNGNYVGFEAPALGADQIWTLPNADGGAGEAIITDGGGALSFSGSPVLLDNDFGSAGFMMTDGAGTYSVVPGGENAADDNLWIGTGCLTNITGGAGLKHVAIGTDCSLNMTTGDQVVSIGYKTNYFNQTGVDVVCIGYNAGYGVINKSHSYNVFIGSEAGYHIEIGSNNLGIGRRALYDLDDGTNNVAMGYYAGYHTEGGTSNTFMGASAGQSNVTGSGNVCLGTQSGFNNTANYNVYIGHQSAYAATSAGNVCIGYRAGYKFTTGGNNILIGSSAGGNTAAAGVNDNIIIGASAGYNLTSYKNIYIGTITGNAATSAMYNLAIGGEAHQLNQTGDYNCIVGVRAGRGAAGQSNNNNAFFGYYAGYDVTTGSNNVLFGYKAGEDLTSGAGNVCLGYMAGSGQLTVDSNELWIANSNTATPLIYGGFPNALLRIQATNFEVIGTSKLGDGGTTNYAEVKADGEINLHGTARVINGQWIDAQAIRAPQTNPAELISHGNLETPAFQFANAIEANQENVTFNMRISNRMDRGVAPTISIGWSADGISPGNCRWQLEYLYTKPDDDTTAIAQATVAVTGAASGTANGMVTTTFPALALPEATDICIHCRITRLSADVLDTIADTVEMHGVCLSFTSNQLGTAT